MRPSLRATSPRRPPPRRPPPHRPPLSPLPPRRLYHRWAPARPARPASAAPFSLSYVFFLSSPSSPAARASRRFPCKFILCWRCRIRTDLVEGRIRVDSGGFPTGPQGLFLRYLTLCNMGILTIQKWIPDSDGFGRGFDSGGFGGTPGPRKWNVPTPEFNS